MADVAYYTKDGLEKLKEELQQLKTSRKDYMAFLQNARVKG